MRRKWTLAFVAMGLGLLCGCTQGGGLLEELLEKNISGAGEIASDEAYENYQKLQEDGLLDESGVYNALEKEEYKELQQMIDHQVRVTLAQNHFLQIQYYYDAEMTREIESGVAYLNPGEGIYCSQPQPVHEYSNMYQFDAFVAYAYDMNGTRGAQLDIIGENNLLLMIPEDYQGTEIGVMPLGKFEKRVLHFLATYSDTNGTDCVASGTWFVNDEACVGNTMEIGATQSYTVKYTYDAGNYYYVSATPEPFASQKAGEVIFKAASAMDDTEEYTVKLHHYVKAIIECNASTRKSLGIEVNGANRDDLTELDTLRVGDEVVLTVSGNKKLYVNGEEWTQVEKVKGGLRYTFLVPDAYEEEYVLSITERLYQVALNAEDEYGTVTYKLNGRTLHNTTTDYVNLMAEDELVMSYVVTADGYVVEHHNNGIFGGLMDWGMDRFQKKRAEVKIELVETMDHTTIRREDYITVKKGE